jgi:hypothetical protein
VVFERHDIGTHAELRGPSRSCLVSRRPADDATVMPLPPKAEQ